MFSFDWVMSLRRDDVIRTLGWNCVFYQLEPSPSLISPELLYSTALPVFCEKSKEKRLSLWLRRKNKSIKGSKNVKLQMALYGLQLGCEELFKGHMSNNLKVFTLNKFFSHLKQWNLHFFQRHSTKKMGHFQITDPILIRAFLWWNIKNISVIRIFCHSFAVCCAPAPLLLMGHLQTNQGRHKNWGTQSECVSRQKGNTVVAQQGGCRLGGQFVGGASLEDWTPFVVRKKNLHWGVSSFN